MNSPQTIADLLPKKIDYLEQKTRLTYKVAWLFPLQGEWTEVNSYIPVNSQSLLAKE